MKKYITEKQFKEIADLGYKGGKSIGDLIEFLNDQKPSFWELQRQADSYRAKFVIGAKYIDYYCPELSDALWEACKEVLKQEL